MSRFNPKNERIKREHLVHKREADQKDPTTIEAIRRAIYAYESYTGFKDLTTFDRHSAIGFKQHLAAPDKRTGRPKSLASQQSILKHLQAFLHWLRSKRAYKRFIHADDIDYLNMSAKNARAAKTSKPKDFPSIDQVKHVIAMMPSQTEIEKRDRAVITLALLTGIRVKALTGLKLKHFDRANELVSQDPNDVDTKFGKRIETFLMPFGDDLKAIIMDWVTYLEKEKLFAPTDPLFPKTLLQQDENLCFAPTGLSREHWQSTSPVREIFKRAFEAAGIRYFNPHSFRDTVAHYGQAYCKSPEEFKALSQNLGHESVLTTFSSYGHVSHHRQGELIKAMGKAKSNPTRDINKLIRMIDKLKETI